MARPEVTGRKSKAKAAAAKKAAAVEPAWYSVRSFCQAHDISEAMFFQMQAEGWGPDVARVGARILISFEAAARWRAEREAAAKDQSPDKTEPATLLA